MIFNEIYGAYYIILEKIISEAGKGSLDRAGMLKIIEENGFSESMASIPDAIRSGRWPVIDDEYETDICNPERPLSDIEKMWLKALLDDPRIRLFTDDISSLEEGLDEVEVLYDKEFFVHFDRYSDGDPYEDKEYVRIFRTVHKAIKAKKKVLISYSGRKRIYRHVINPVKIEYSSKDDKFRLIGAADSGHVTVYNFANMRDVRMLDEDIAISEVKNDDICTVELELLDGRNALSRAMIQFSDLKKETVKLDDTTYSIKIMYHKADETEILIRILSFGPMIKVLGPDDFLWKIKRRIMKQAVL